MTEADQHLEHESPAGVNSSFCYLKDTLKFTICVSNKVDIQSTSTNTLLATESGWHQC